jgi:hypothetical protein
MENPLLLVTKPRIRENIPLSVTFLYEDIMFQAQNVLIIIIVAAIIDFIVGAIVGPRNVLQQAQGFVGFNCEYDTALFSRAARSSHSSLQQLHE